MSKFDDHPTEDTSEQVEVRRQKLAKLKQAGYAGYPNDFKSTFSASEVVSKFSNLSDEELTAKAREVRLAGRIMAIRKMGKASFFHVQDRSGRLQVYARSDRLGDEAYGALCSERTPRS